MKDVVRKQGYVFILKIFVLAKYKNYL